ncbi:MAG: hypothetical protein MUE36_13285 [Acidimicrobiales bacterium]|jgi:hypothetical protein|nr:hypothetical protein [Acidimicrobiales bacterium]
MSMTSSTVVEKLSGVLSARMGRRGFFARSAVVGTALAANPVAYALTPTDAYAAICSCQGQGCACGSLCCDGYTEFCCTLTGRNQCPPGSVLAGWWKVDGTGFCSGPRYYMDCNAPCNGCGCGGNGVCSGACSGTGCGCANGDCNNRKAGCTNFRYGQCNQGIACLGPIVCRLVTCIAPWEIDGTCTGTVRVDNATANHDRPCLHTVDGSVESATEVTGGIRVTGWALDADTNAPIDVHVYVDGVGAGSGVASRSRPDVAAAFPGQGPNHGYDITVPAAPGVRQVCVYGINVGPSGNGNLLLGCRTVRVGSPFGNFEGFRVGTGTITLTGWAIDPDTTGPVDIHVYIDGNGAGSFVANRFRADVGQAYPAYGPNHGFDITVPISGGPHRVCVYAINTGIAGTTNPELGCIQVDIGSPLGNLDTVDPAAGGVLVGGWAVDLDDLTTSVTVDLRVDGRLAATTVANTPFPALQAYIPAAGPNRGYRSFVPAAPGRRTLSAVARNVGPGVDKVLAQRTVDVRAGDPFGNLELAAAGPRQIRVVGWMIDPDSTAPIDVHVYVNGAFAGLGVADRNRPDVGAAYPGFGPVHGFDVVVPAAAGLQTVQVYAINVGPGTTNPLIGTRSVFVGGNPFGNFEAVRDSSGAFRVSGWVIDPDTAGPVELHVYANGGGVGRAVADRDRPDVGIAYPLYGAAHGFDATFPVARGTYDVCVYAINLASGNTNPLLACRRVVVS